MDSEKLKVVIGKNIAAYRKRFGLTQADLADKLNYSDKVIRGIYCENLMNFYRKMKFVK